MNSETIESFLLRMELDFEELEPGMWVIGTDRGLRIIAHLSPPVLLLRSTVFEIGGEQDDREGLFRKLLEMNAEDLVRGAYALDGDDVILTDALDLDSLDFDSLQSALDSMDMALVSHHEVLAPFRSTTQESQPEGAR